MPLYLEAQTKSAKSYTLIAFEDSDKVPAYRENVEFMEAVLKDCGLKFQSHQAPVLRGLQLVDSGDADFFIAATKSAGERYKNLIPSSFPYIKSTIWVFFNKDSKQLRASDSLKGLSGVVLLNSPLVLLDSATPTSNMTEVSTVEQGLEMLLAKHVDFLLANKAVVQGIIDQSSKKYAKIDVKSKPLYELNLYFWTHKRNQSVMPLIEGKLKEALKVKNHSQLKYLKSVLNTSP